MTMLLGINLTNHTFISADTRATNLNDGSINDNFQKIEILPKHGLIIATAGRVNIASEIYNSIVEGLIKTPITCKSISGEIYNIIKEKEQSKQKISNSIFGPVSMLFSEYDGRKFNMYVLRLTFEINKDIIPIISKHEVKNGQYVEIGYLIDSDSPIRISNLSDDSLKYLNNKNYEKISYYDYTLATDMIFKMAKKISSEKDILKNAKLKNNPIGGKTITIMASISSENNFNYFCIPGFKTIIDYENQYQDVSTVTRLDLSSNRFYLRDLRKEGKIISNIEYKGYGTEPILKYDSCRTDFSKEDIYYTGISQKIDGGNMYLEF